MDSTIIKKQCDELHKDIQQLTMKATQCSTWRLILIVAMIVGMYQGSEGRTLFYGFAVICLGLFLLIAKRHTGIKHTLEDKETLLEVYSDIEHRKKEAWKTFEDRGDEFLNEQMTQAYDLDLFGKASLYQYITCAKTPSGRALLASWLQVHKVDEVQIAKRQQAVAECLKKEAFTLEMIKASKLFGKHARKLKKKKMERFLSFMEEPMAPQPIVFTVASFVMPLFVLGTFVMVALGSLHLSIAMAAFSVSLAAAILMFLKNNEQLSAVESMSEVMKDYVRIFETIRHQRFESTFLQEQSDTLGEAIIAIQKLNQLLGLVRIRSNSILFLFVNGFFMMDFHCTRAIQKWKSSNGEAVRVWLQAVASFESIVSLSQIGLVKQQSCFPVWKQTLEIEMDEMTHPMLCEEKAIANSLSMRNGSYVITGSNMSGKTTFLRTIGVNLVLAMAGAPVCAVSFSACPLSIYTSMRVHDDVSEGISTFYAEILRIKQMMDASRQAQPMLVLIDEIFKGTNSADRILCAKQAIRSLHAPHVITMVSTHDFELCDLEKDQEVHAKNYHFSEYYEDDNICFDYLLKDGRCTTTNAKQLMKLAGF